MTAFENLLRKLVKREKKLINFNVRKINQVEIYKSEFGIFREKGEYDGTCGVRTENSTTI